jgi:antitoxin component YwqK of YwqJK toxin-antitoxin module
MSYINGIFAEYWIVENHPENGLFRVYWTEDGIIAERWEGRKHTVEPQVSLEDCGLGIRYEWYYKDGKQHGKSLSWYPNGQLKQERIHDNGKVMECIYYYKCSHPVTVHDCGCVHVGQKWKEEIYNKNALPVKEMTWWPDGFLQEESIYNDKCKKQQTTFYSPDGKDSSKMIYDTEEPWNGKETMWYENSQKSDERIYKDGKLVSEKTWNLDGTEDEEHDYYVGHDF